MVYGLRTRGNYHIAPTPESRQSASSSPLVVGRDPVVSTPLDVDGGEVHSVVAFWHLEFEDL